MEYSHTEECSVEQQHLSHSWSCLHDQIQDIGEDIAPYINALHTRNKNIELEIEKEVYRFSLLPFAPARSNGTGKPDIVVDLSAAEKKIKFALQDISCLPFLRLPVQNQLPSDILCIVVEFHLDAILSATEKSTGSPIRIDAVELAPDIPPKCDYELFFQLSHTSTGLKTIGSFLLERVTLPWFAQAFRDNFPPAADPGYRNLPVRVGFMAGNIRSLTFGEIKELCVGYVILDRIKIGHRKKADIIVTVQGRPMWSCRADRNGLITVVSSMEQSMNDKRTEFNPVSQNKTDDEKIHIGKALQKKMDLNSLEMDIGFELGSLKMPMSELESVQDGYVFDLKHTAVDYVTIHANGRPIGRGEMVNIGQRLGVRVTGLLFSKD